MKLLHRILVATDFSTAARLAVSRAGQLASQHAAELHIVHATPDWNLFSRWTAARKEHYDLISLHAQQALRAEVERVLQTYGVHARGELQLGRASEVILRARAAYEPDLIVVGARGEHKPPVAPAALGGTTLKLMLSAVCPLLLVRNEHTDPYRTSLAAIHATSELSRQLARWATALVPEGECHIVHAYDTPYLERIHACGVSRAESDLCVAAAEQAARKSLDQLVASIEPGARVQVHLVRGNPLGVLVTETARYNPQLVVIGRHEGPGGPGMHDNLGDRGLRMAYHTPVDVLVVP